MHERKESIMLQDLDFGYLDNQYRRKTPQPQDTVLCMRGAEVLICRLDFSYKVDCVTIVPCASVAVLEFRCKVTTKRHDVFNSRG